MITFSSLAELTARAGQEIGTSPWLAMTQERISAFADVTDDHQWIHVDPARAARETPFGTTIAHGFLTLSLTSALLRGTVAIEGLRMSINYGLDRVRFISPVPAGALVRARIALGRVEAVRDAVQVTWSITIERDGCEKPCVAADWIVRYYPADASDTAADASH
jgi:acyl dehydratase